MWNAILMWTIGIIWYSILGLCGVVVLYEVGAMLKLWPSRLASPLPNAVEMEEPEELSA